MNIFLDNIIVKSGWVMVPIILGSIVALAISIERAVFFWKIKLNTESFVDEIYFLIEKGEIERALGQCKKVNHPMAAVFLAGLLKIEDDVLEIDRAMEREGERQITLLEKNLIFLMAIVGVEPLMGFLGTILGLIRAFMAWEQFSTTVTVDQLAAGIYQAMVTTASGLIVAIPFYLVYNIFTNKINTITHALNYYGDKMVGLINKKKNIAKT
ncbi:MAG: MotA/TolQ/ExbB proton channel family protein [Spirochaetes bacterium]|nr:MotA/TolQ/ExbB proton channel family protein [Spirochaetota bacterium]